MGHGRTVQSEFHRQARAFAESPALRAPELTLRIAEALRGASPRRVIDIACGPGVLVPSLSEIAEQVVGIDLTAKPLRLAREACADASFVRALAGRAPFAPGSFDAAVMRLAIHHFDDPQPILEDTRRLLSDDGRLVVLDVLSSEDPEIAALHNAIERLRDPSHALMRSDGDLRALITSAGFEVVSSDAWSSERSFAEWARIISEPTRMSSLELVLRHLSRAGVESGMSLREEEGELLFQYEWCLLVARTAGGGAKA